MAWPRRYESRGNRRNGLAAAWLIETLSDAPRNLHRYPVWDPVRSSWAACNRSLIN
jgi:hypothetical protein